MYFYGMLISISDGLPFHLEDAALFITGPCQPISRQPMKSIRDSI